MEGHMKFEEADLMSDLMQGKELTKQLHNHMFLSSSSHETKEVLLEKILLSYEKALTKLKWEANVGDRETKIINGNMMDYSPCSFTNENPKSEVLDQEIKHKSVSKRRKIIDIWKKQVKVCSGEVIEESLDDGHSWRKYGQKDILGANFPRGYYRCTHKHAQGCLVTKQVQKSDKDPTTYEITYKGRHTCIQANHANKAFPSRSKICLGEHKHHNHQKNEAQEKKIEQPPHETIFSFSSELEVKLEDLETKENIFPSFCFPSPSIGSENEDNNMIENPFMECFSPTFLSHATSESNIFCLSPCHYGSNGLGLSVQTSESIITDVVSATTSITNSPIVNLDELNLFLDNVDFDTFPIYP
ncbi:hypothetical protein Lal_00025311 [Lupinus albus]|uniref:Putative transcription factor WRKY family n=1 Tax=Lupinus albus TaxID=3870 RepID=A0A6A5NYC4_LUPAL|nr:putative transcription factor WRKY family [Lupinus albus]KAF1889981.1 hypothetical protein Lal_00025311 [Lupinus albus]